MKCRSKYGVEGCKAGWRCPEYVASFVPREGAMSEYYAATDKKHFHGGADVPGSKFLASGLNRLEDVVFLALSLKKDLNTTDDREYFKFVFNCDDDAFSDNFRYIYLPTPGTLGAISSEQLKDEDTVEIVRTKPGAHCSIVYTTKKQPLTDASVLIMTDNSETGKPMVITAFPGVPTKPVASEELDELEGQTTTVGFIRNSLGIKKFWANTRLQ